jgi:hypothetical protein
MCRSGRKHGSTTKLPKLRLDASEANTLAPFKAASVVKTPTLALRLRALQGRRGRSYVKDRPVRNQPNPQEADS